MTISSILFLVTLVTPLFFWTILVSALRGRRYEMDWGGSSGTFLVTYALYRKMAWFICGFGLASSGWLAYSHLYTPLAVILFPAGLYAFLFNLWTPYVYESYLHMRYPRSLLTRSTEQERATLIVNAPSNYTASKYALTLSLALSSVLCFLFGLIGGIAILLER